MVVPTGTLNHFARDVGVYDLQEAVDATGAGEAVAVDLALVELHPGRGADPASDAVTRVHCFLNTASLGSYPDLVRLREQWQPRWGKWPAFAAALVIVLRRAEPVSIKIEATVAHGVVPVRRQRALPPEGHGPGLAADARLGAARRPLAARRRAVLPAAGGARRCCWARSGTAGSTSSGRSPELDVELAVPGMLATDGEVVEHVGPLHVPGRRTPIAVYRRDEERWPGRDRPFQG